MRVTGTARGRRGDAVLGSVVARADTACDARELHQYVLGNLAAEPDRNAADLDIADGITFGCRDLKHGSQPKPAVPRTMVQKLEAGVPSGVTQPVVFRLSMYSPTGLASVIDAPWRASAFTWPPIVGSLARPATPYPAQQISAPDPLTVGLGERAARWPGRRFDLRFQRVCGMREVHGAIGRVPLVSRIVYAVLEKIGHLDAGADQSLVKSEHFVLVALWRWRS